MVTLEAQELASLFFSTLKNQKGFYVLHTYLAIIPSFVPRFKHRGKCTVKRYNRGHLCAAMQCQYKYAQSAGIPSTTVVDTCLRELLSVLIHNLSFNINR